MAKACREWLVVAAILLLAAALRLGAPGVIEFKRDEAALSQLALDMARGRVFPLLGISSSVGIPNAPFNVYILALPYAFSSDPTVATQFIGLLNSAVVGLTYALARRYYGVPAALVAAMALTVSPWAVLYSRKIWAQDLLPFFTLLTLGSGLLGFHEGKRWGQVLHLPLLVITGQIHYGAFVLIPLSLYLIVLGRRRWTRAFALSFVLAALLTAPYALGVARALTANGLRAASAETSSPDGLGFAPAGLEYALLTIAGTDIHSLAGAERFRDYLSGVPSVYPLFDALALTVLAALAWLLLRAWWRRDARTPVDVLIVLWVLIPVGVFSFTWTTLYPHYLIPIIPAAFLALGAAAQDVWAQRGITWRRAFAAGAVALGVILALQAWLLVALFNFLYANATPGGFGTPLAYLLPARAAILEQTPPSVLVNLDGQAVGFDGEATVWDFLLADVVERRFIDANTFVYPAESTLYLSNCERYQVRYDSGAPRFFYLRPTGNEAAPYEGCYVLSRRGGEVFEADYTAVNSEGLTFDNGVRIFGYVWDNQCLRLFWEIGATTTQNYSFAVHFVDAAGQRLANADALSWLGRYWRVGDRVIRTLCPVEVPAGVVGVDIGMYTYDGTSFNNANLLDSSGAAVGQMLRIALNASP
ncbi:MAG: glycosyltransferase family 39 protein [Chloroflexi bacterium]|nr:glycosyltransferase family 39 protein [Chloroflexota bacterium]